MRICLPCVLALCMLTGCMGDLVTSGPKMMTAGVEAGSKVMTVLVSKMNPGDMTANSRFDVSNPEFVGRVEAGTLFVVNFTLRMIGGKASADVSAGGQGGVLDPGVVAIFENQTLSETQQDKILSLVEKLLLAPANDEIPPQEAHSGDG